MSSSLVATRSKIAEEWAREAQLQTKGESLNKPVAFAVLRRRLKYDYTTDLKALEDTVREEFVTQYNAEIDAEVADIDAGNFVLHEDVEKLFADRRKVLN